MSFLKMARLGWLLSPEDTLTVDDMHLVRPEWRDAFLSGDLAYERGDFRAKRQNARIEKLFAEHGDQALSQVLTDDGRKRILA